MSERQAKKKRKNESSSNVLLINHQEYIGKDQVVAYLLNKLKSFSGYKFISIGPVGSLYASGENKQTVLITAHWSIPAMQKNGRYMSDRDRVLDAMHVDDPEFKGIVIDKHGHGMLGNPFAPQEVLPEQVPALGDKPVETEPSPYTGDESVETL